MKVNHIHSYFKFDNINYLGYYSCNVFKAISTNISFTEILKCELLSEKFNKGIGESIKLSSIDFGPFDTKALSERDFMKTDFKGLKDALEKYWTEETWGVDLPVFKQNFKEVQVILRTQDLLKGEFYSINIETAREVLTPDPNFWTYFFGFVCIENESQTIMTAYFGLD